MNKKKWLLIVVLVIVVVAAFVFFKLWNGEKVAYAKLSENSVQHNLSVWSANDDNTITSVVTERQYEQCWVLGEDIERYYIVVDVSDDKISIVDSCLQISVKYFDSGNGSFTLLYDSESGDEKQAETVFMQAENVWKEHDFVINDAAFSDALLSGDFAISVYLPSDDSFSTDRVYIKQISVNKLFTINSEVIEGTYFSATGSFKDLSMSVEGIEDSGVYSKIKGQSCWSVDPSEGTYAFLFDALNTENESTGVEITVKYLDEGNGLLCLMYNSLDVVPAFLNQQSGNIYELGDEIIIGIDFVKDAEKLAQMVELKDSGRWKECTFYIEDAFFDNMLDGYDFRVCAYELTDCQYQPAGLSIAGVEVNSVSGVSVSPTEINIDFTLTDTTSGDILLKQEYSAALEDGELYQECELTAGYCSTFEIEISVISDISDQASTKTMPFSITIVNSERQPNDIFGVCTHFGKGWYDTDFDLMTEMISQAGIGWIRDEMEWSLAETTKGEVEVLPEWDEYIDAALYAGLTPVIILDFGNDFYDESGPPYSEEGLEAFLNYVETIVTHFEGRVQYFEIWNEYNLEGTVFNSTSRSPQDYAEMLRLCYQKIKSIDPEAFVIAGAMAGADIEWLEAVLAEGVIDYMDAVSLHTYVYPYSPDSGMLFEMTDMIMDLLADVGREIPIWITEVGWPNSEDEIGVPEHAAAAFLVRTYTQAIAEGIDKVFWYNWQNKGVSSSEPEYNFGLIRNWDEAQSSSAVKATYLAYNTLTRLIRSAEYVSDLSTGDIAAYKFSDDDRVLIIIWSTASDISASMKTDEDEILIYDIYGNKHTSNSSNGIFDIDISGCPIFIEIQAVTDNLSIIP